MSDWEAPERVWIGPGIHWQEPPEGTEYVRADRLAAVERERDCVRDALHEISDALRNEATTDEQKVWMVCAILTNGPLDTAPGGPREDECWRLRARVEELEADKRALGDLIGGLYRERGRDAPTLYTLIRRAFRDADALLSGGSREEPRHDTSELCPDCDGIGMTPTGGYLGDSPLYSDPPCPSCGGSGRPTTNQEDHR